MFLKDANNFTVNKASTLTTARTINGTSFNGSANITTANWGTARNIYIADSSSTNKGAAVLVNGSGDVTLKLPATIKASLTGNASTATKATQDSAGQQINTTYIKGLSVSGKTITYTKGDGTTGTITTQDTNTTYSTGTASTSGLTKLYTGTGTATDGTMTQAAINTALTSHTHNYAGSSSAGGAANSATTLATARKINGTSFNGSADITTANWGTARTLTIGSTGKSVNGSANVSWSLSEIGAAAASHNHDSSYFKKQLGSVTDFNKCLTEGQYSYGTDALNTPIKGYGTLIVYVNDGGTHDNSSNWIWQLAYTTGTNENYIRQKVNSGGWTPWVRLTLPAYDNAWNDGYVRTRPDGVTAVGKYLDFYPTSGGSYSRLDTNGSYLQFRGHKVGLMNVGTAAPTTSTCPVGFIYGQY